MHVPQERSLFPLMSVWDNLLIGGHSLRDRRVVRDRATDIAERFPLVAERRRDPAGSLSGGQQKVVEIARALMLRPKLILMDEPSIGLEPKARHRVFELIGELKTEGHTVLLVEQNARAGLATSDRGAVLDEGRVALEGPAHNCSPIPAWPSSTSAAARTHATESAKPIRRPSSLPTEFIYLLVMYTTATSSHVRPEVAPRPGGLRIRDPDC